MTTTKPGPEPREQEELLPPTNGGLKPAAPQDPPPHALPSVRERRRALLAKFVHFMTALTILLKAMSKLEQGGGVYTPLVLFLFASTAYIVFMTLMHDRLHAHSHLIDASVYAIECVVLSIVTYLFWQEGKTSLATVSAIAPIGFAIALVVRLAKGRAHAAG
jgi:hypothetical protein